MFSPYAFAWLASLIYGLEAVVGKLVSKHTIANFWLFNFFWNLFILVLVIPLAWWYGAGWPTQWTSLVLTSLFYAANTISYVWALYRLDVSVFAPLYSFRVAMAVVFGVWLAGEVLTNGQYLLLAVIFLCGLGVSLDERLTLRSFFNSHIAVALFSMLTSVLAAVFLKQSVAEVGYWSTTLWSILLMQLWLVLTWPLFKIDMAKVTARQYGAMFLPALLGTAALLAANKAYAHSVSLSSTIISLPFSMIGAFLFSVFAPELLEKHTLKVYAVRFASAAIMIVAALGL